jgi:hypothetical protein
LKKEGIWVGNADVFSDLLDSVRTLTSKQFDEEHDHRRNCRRHARLLNGQMQHLEGIDWLWHFNGIEGSVDFIDVGWHKLE